jgi:hypothetical protein
VAGELLQAGAAVRSYAVGHEPRRRAEGRKLLLREAAFLAATHAASPKGSWARIRRRRTERSVDGSAGVRGLISCRPCPAAVNNPKRAEPCSSFLQHLRIDFFACFRLCEEFLLKIYPPRPCGAQFSGAE